MLNNYFDTSMRVYLPVFVLLFAVTYYLSTIFIADEEWINTVLQGDVEKAKTFNVLFFSFSGIRIFLSWIIKGVMISWVCNMVTGLAFGAFLKVSFLSMFAYVFSNIAGFIYKLVFLPTSAMELRRNPLSLWSTGMMDDQSNFIQNLSWHTNPFEALYLFLFAYGAVYILRQNDSKIRDGVIVSIVVAVDLAYIIITALW